MWDKALLLENTHTLLQNLNYAVSFSSWMNTYSIIQQELNCSHGCQATAYMLPRNKIHDPWLPRGGSFSTTNMHMPKSDTLHPGKVMVYIWAIQQSKAHYTANLYHSWSHHKLWFLHAKPNDKVKAVLWHNSLSFGLSYYTDWLGTIQAKEKNMWRFLSAWRISQANRVL